MLVSSEPRILRFITFPKVVRMFSFSSLKIKKKIIRKEHFPRRFGNVFQFENRFYFSVIPIVILFIALLFAVFRAVEGTETVF